MYRWTYRWSRRSTTTGPSSGGYFSCITTISPSSMAVTSIRTGEYLHRYFDEYWTDPDRKAFLFRVEGALAGFALVFTGEPRDIAEFFVMRKYRGRGAGAQAASSLFARFPGRWTVRQQLTNPAATAFWRKAIRYPFQEHEQGTEIVQSFISADMD